MEERGSGREGEMEDNLGGRREAERERGREREGVGREGGSKGEREDVEGIEDVGRG